MTIPILFFSPVPDFKGGAERSLMDLVRNPNITPHLVVPAEGPISQTARELGIPVRILDFGAISEVHRPFRIRDGVAVARDLVKAALKLKSICQDLGVAIVHSNGLKSHAINVTARALGGLPAVIHIRDIANSRVESLTWKLLQLGATRTVLVSRACWSQPILPPSVVVIHNGISPQPEIVHKPSADGMRVGFIGRIHPHKGLHSLIDALAIANSEGEDIRLTVRGAFAEETPNYRQETDSQIRNLHLKDRVTFEGFISDPSKVYEGLDVVCVPSELPDPLPRSVMEAAARGLVVIAARSGGVPEMLTNGVNGYIVDNTQELAKDLVDLARDPSLRLRLGKVARADISERFSIKRLHIKITDLYRDITRSGDEVSPKTAKVF